MLTVSSLLDFINLNLEATYQEESECKKVVPLSIHWCYNSLMIEKATELVRVGYWWLLEIGREFADAWTEFWEDLWKE